MPTIPQYEVLMPLSLLGISYPRHVGDPRALSGEELKALAIQQAAASKNAAACARHAEGLRNALPPVYVREYTPPLPHWRRFLSWLAQRM